MKSISTVMLTVLVGLVTTNLSATTVTTAQALAQSSILNLSDSDSSPTSASALVADSDVSAQGVSTSSGHIATSASFFSDGGPFTTVSAEATWSEAFTATAGSSAQFNFYIPGAAIGFESNNTTGLSGGYFVEITLNGDSLFYSSAEIATLVGTPHTPADLDLFQDGTVLNSTFDTDIAQTMGLIGGGAGYRFSSYSGSLNLSPVAGDNLITYTMGVYVNGRLGETSALASIGDPLNLSQDPAEGVIFTIDNGTPVVPVPAAVWLFGSGLLGLIGFARRKD